MEKEGKEQQVHDKFGGRDSQEKRLTKIDFAAEGKPGA